MEYAIGFIVFAFGAALGSFVLVVADRYNTGLSFWKGRSICFSCGAPLKLLDLVPLFSFIFLRGHCRYCRSKIPAGAFLTELAMGALSVLAAFKSGLLAFNLSTFPFFHLSFAFSWPLVISYLLAVSIFAVILLISIYDLKHFIIPDTFLIVFLFFSSLFIFASSGFFQSFSLSVFPFRLLSALAVTLPFLIIFLVSKGRWIGFGDIKYILAISFFLGLAEGLSAVILSFWIGAAFSLLAISLKSAKSQLGLLAPLNNLTIKSEIPFGPFLSIGIILSFYLNADLFQIRSLLSSL